MSKLQWWGYLHTNGSIHTKRYLDSPEDLTEARESSFVAEVLSVFDAEDSVEAHRIVMGHFFK